MVNNSQYTVFGIKNCDTVKKALTWLDASKVPYTFHDYKSKGIDEVRLRGWVSQKGWEALVNKKGMTWRQLPAVVQQSVTNEDAAIELMLTKTSVIKRPLIEKDGKVIVIGFNREEYSGMF
jgi:arsenate reductase (glutaredoxin)